MTETPRALALVTDIAEGTAVLEHVMAGRWFLPLDVPACGAVAEVPAEATNDNTARRFVCDRAANHIAEGVPKHRQVTDPDEGETIEWPDDITRGLAAALASTMAEVKTAADAADAEGLALNLTRAERDAADRLELARGVDLLMQHTPAGWMASLLTSEGQTTATGPEIGPFLIAAADRWA